jgi:hypothetical protein
LHMQHLNVDSRMKEDREHGAPPHASIQIS